ncbi:MAG: metal ABC transporter substrate-binding protein [Cryobacterium sp.]
MPKSCRSLLGAGALLIAAAFALTGCAAPPPQPSDTATAGTDSRPLVLTSFTVLADMVREVAGEAVQVESITKVGSEIHGYEPTPSDLTRVRDADLVFHNGLGLEAWFGQFTAGVDVPIVTLSDGIEPLAITVGEYSGKPNPHAWMSPTAGAVYVANIAAALTELVPESAERITANAAGYTSELAALSDELTEVIADVPPAQRMLITCEGAFSYLARDVGLEEGYLWAVNQESQGTPQQVVSLIDTVRERQVPAVFCESTVSAASQQVVADESGAVMGGTLYVDSLSDGAPVPSYLELLRYDMRTIAAGLSS